MIRYFFILILVFSLSRVDAGPLLLRFSSRPSPPLEGERVLFVLTVMNTGNLPVVLRSVSLSLKGINPESSSFIFAENIPAVQYRVEKKTLWVTQQLRYDNLANRAGRAPQPPSPVAAALIPFYTCRRWLLPGGSTSISFAAIPFDTSGHAAIEASVSSSFIKKDGDVYLSPSGLKGHKLYTVPPANLVKFGYDRVRQVPQPEDGLALVIPGESLSENVVQTTSREFQLKPQTVNFQAGGAYSKGSLFLKPEEMWLSTDGREAILISASTTEQIHLDPFPWLLTLLLEQKSSLEVKAYYEKLPRPVQAYFNPFPYRFEKTGTRLYDLPRIELVPLLRKLSQTGLELTKDGEITSY